MQTSVTNESTPQQKRGEHSFSHFLFKVSQTRSDSSPVCSESQEGLSLKSKELGKLPQWKESGFLSIAAQHEQRKFSHFEDIPLKNSSENLDTAKVHNFTV